MDKKAKSNNNSHLIKETRGILKAFTLAELIVVIIILAILGLISFIYIQGYTQETRDAKRLNDLSELFSKVIIEKIAGVEPYEVIKETSTGRVIIGGNIQISHIGTIDFEKLKQEDTFFKDPLTGKDYEAAYSIGEYTLKSSKEAYEFVQLRAKSEVNPKKYIVVGRYFQIIEETDSDSLFDLISDCDEQETGGGGSCIISCSEGYILNQSSNQCELKTYAWSYSDYGTCSVTTPIIGEWGNCSATTPTMGDWGSCSVSCGGGTKTRTCTATSGNQTRTCTANNNGTQTRTATCILTNQGLNQKVDDSYCNNLTKDSLTKTCSSGTSLCGTSGYETSKTCSSGTSLCGTTNYQTSQSCNTQSCYTWARKGKLLDVCNSANGKKFEIQQCINSSGNIVSDSYCSGSPSERDSSTYCCASDSNRRSAVANAFGINGIIGIGSEGFEYRCNLTQYSIGNHLNCAIRNGLVVDNWGATINNNARNLCLSICKNTSYACSNAK